MDTGSSLDIIRERDLKREQRADLKYSPTDTEVNREHFNDIEMEVYKVLSLTPNKLEQVTIKPKIKDGKLLFNKEDYRYILDMEDQP